MTSSVSPRFARTAAIGFMAVGLMGIGVAATAVPAQAAPTAPASAGHLLKGSVGTSITWENSLSSGLTFQISEISNFDWDGNSRPDHAAPEGVQDYTLAANTSHDEHLEINSNGKQHFTVSMTDATGNTVTTFRLMTKNVQDKGVQWVLESGDDIYRSDAFSYTGTDGASHQAYIKIDGGNYSSTITFSPVQN